MALRLKVTIAGQQRYVKTVVGQADSGNTIQVSERPTEVRIFSPSKPWGQLINEGAGGWSYDATQNRVTLPAPLASGEKAVAFVGDVFLFESIVSNGGLPGFVTNTGSAADRTKEQDVIVVNEDTYTKYLNVRITSFDSFVNDGVITKSWFSVKKSSDTNYTSASSISSSSPFWITTQATDGNFDAIGPGQSRTIRVKCEAAPNLDVKNYRNWYFVLESIAEDTR
jgi:hypothetical protein